MSSIAQTEIRLIGINNYNYGSKVKHIFYIISCRKCILHWHVSLHCIVSYPVSSIVLAVSVTISSPVRAGAGAGAGWTQ